jgi:uncharacterized protein
MPGERRADETACAARCTCEANEMKLNEATGAGDFRIRRYEPGRLTVNDEVLVRSVIVTAGELLRDWPPQRVEEIEMTHLETVIALDPEVVLLGTGERQVFPDRALLRELIVRGIGVEVMDTAAASRTYNLLMSEERRVAAVLLLE